MSSLALTSGNHSAKPAFSGGARGMSTCNEDMDLAFWILDGLVGVIILAGNALTCAVFIGTPQLRNNVMNVFLLSLAISDLLMSLLVVPLFAAVCETQCQYSVRSWCWLFAMLRDIPFEGVILNLIAVTYDRFVAVFRPLMYSVTMTRRRVTVILFFAWFLPFATGLIRLTWTFSDLPIAEKKAIDRRFNIFLIFTFVLIPAVGIFLVNLMIMKTIKKHTSRVNPAAASERGAPHSETSNSETRRETIKRRKGTMSCVLVVLVFLACWFPRIVYNIFYLAARPDLASPLFVKITMFFVILQSSVNPIIYTFYRQEFRQASLRLLRLD